VNATHESARPVYVLGAGFSKAIQAVMPVTDELGMELKRRLADVEELDLREGQTFEDWLTVQITPLPFLARHSNARRVASAERVIAEIAHALDERVAEATANECPTWLWQLLAIWHAEKAVILTFNYDTLLERALNTHPLATYAFGKAFQRAFGDHLVYPAPSAPQPQLLGDTGSPHNANSLQILKLHGSLAWYWASGDPTGSTLVREREKHIFGSSEPFADEADYSGAKSLDRYLVPPVLSKDGYYGSYLANSLWRLAQKFVAGTKSLTLIGYSLPAGDRVTSELVGEYGGSSPVHVVDRSPSEGLLERINRLGLPAEAASSGPDCVPAYVKGRMEAAAESLSSAIDDATAGSQVFDVVVSFANGWRTAYQTDLFALAWDKERQIFSTREIDRTQVDDPRSSYREIALNVLPTGVHDLEDFVTVERLRELVRNEGQFRFEHERIAHPFVAIGCSLMERGSGLALLIQWAPALDSTSATSFGPAESVR